MKRKLNYPTMGEILLEEYMKPYNLSAYKLAQAIHVPVSRIQDILHDRRKITMDTSLRLAKFFGVSDMFFINIQNSIDARTIKNDSKNDLDSIQPYLYNNVNQLALNTVVREKTVT